jgi:ribokinase
MSFFKKSHDFIAIGETTIDAFIRLNDATVEKDANGENPKLCIPFGTKIPYESVEEVLAVGNAANASVAAARLGLRSALVAYVGKDHNGEKCIQSLKNDGVSTEYISVDKTKDTNYHYVLLFGDERTILQKHSHFNYVLPDIDKPKWIYLTSLGDTSLPLHEKLGEYLKANPDVKLSFQPGIFQIKMGKDKLKNIYDHTDVFFCNIEEAKEILGISNHIEVKDLIIEMKKTGPKVIVLTDGMKGAYTYDGSQVLYMPSYPDPKPPIDRTGAGDAFSSTFTAALAAGESIETALKWAPINSMSVVQEIGAQKGLLSRKALEEWLAKAPSDYKVKVL